MTSQQTFCVNPSYTGPMVIAECLRKMKTNSGLNRMLSTHNKRYFVLDLTYMNFYYLPDKTAHFSNSTNIPLNSITGIKVTNVTQGLEDDKVWKYEFVITTKKRMLELISDSKASMERLLFAFSNIINVNTNRPLFNWSYYIGEAEGLSSPLSNLPLYTQPAEGVTQEPMQSLYTSPQSSPSKQSERPEEEYQQTEADNIMETQPNSTEEIVPEIARIREAAKPTETESDNNKDSDSQSDDQKDRQGNGLRRRQISLVNRRKANALAAAARGKGFEVSGESDEKGSSPSTGVTGSPCDKEVETSPVGGKFGTQGEFIGFDVKEEVAPELVKEQKAEKLQIKIEMNLDKIEDEPVEKKVVESHRDISKRVNPGEESTRRRQNQTLTLARNQKSVSMKTMVSRPVESEFVGLNEVDLAQDKKKNSFRTTQVASDSHEKHGNGVATERIKLGAGVKFSLFKKSEQELNESPSKKENPTIKKPVNDEDWDKEMFGYGKGQISPLKPKNQEFNTKQSSGSKYSFNEKRNLNQLSQKRVGFVSSRQGTHNDWDDDL